MKIISYNKIGDRIKIETDYEPMPTFVYFADRFKNIDQVKSEINRNITHMENMAAKEDQQFSKLKKELDKECLKQI